MKNILVQFSLLSLCLLIASCGGGSEGQTEESPSSGSETGSWNEMRWDEANWQ